MNGPGHRLDHIGTEARRLDPGTQIIRGRSGSHNCPWQTCTMTRTPKELTRVPLKPVVPTDPFGTSSRYRELRVLLVRPQAQHAALCWLRRATDGSLSFGFSASITIAHVGYARNTGRTLETRGEPQRVTSPLETRSNVHATLHPSGTCQVRAARHPPLFRYDIKWHPVEKPFTWLYAYSPVVGMLPKASRRKRDALVSAPAASQCVRLRVDVLPRPERIEPGTELRFSQQCLDTLFHVGPDYVCRVGLFAQAAAPPAILLATDVSLDPLATL